jgi:hypothetical protein
MQQQQQQQHQQPQQPQRGRGATSNTTRACSRALSILPCLKLQDLRLQGCRVQLGPPCGQVCSDLAAATLLSHLSLTNVTLLTTQHSDVTHGAQTDTTWWPAAAAAAADPALTDPS